MIVLRSLPERGFLIVNGKESAESRRTLCPGRIIETCATPGRDRGRRSVSPESITPNLANAHERNLVRCKPNGHRQPEPEPKQTPKHSHNLPSEFSLTTGPASNFPDLKLPLNSFGII